MTELLPYRIERTLNRSSQARLVDDVIVIRLAGHLSAREEQRHIENLLKRMSKAAKKMLSKTAVNPFKEIVRTKQSGVVTLASGKKIHFELRLGKSTKAKEKEDGWLIDVHPNVKDKILHRFLWRLVSASALASLDLVVRKINEETLNVRIRSVKLRFGTSRWGSCSHNGAIMLNPALLFLPEDVLRYVIVHELAHVIHHNHSAKFWATVEKAMPDYDKAYKELRMFRLPRL